MDLRNQEGDTAKRETPAAGWLQISSPTRTNENKLNVYTMSLKTELKRGTLSR